MFMSHLQPRPGLQIIRDNFMAACEVSPWADKDLISESLSQDSTVLIPVYAIRYHWLTAGKYFTVSKIQIILLFQHMLNPIWTSLLVRGSLLK